MLWLIYSAICLLVVSMLLVSRKSKYFWLFGITWAVIGIKWAWFDHHGWPGLVLPLVVTLVATLRGFRELAKERHGSWR